MSDPAGARAPARMVFSAEVIAWRGPAPFVFVPVPPREAGAIAGMARYVSYGWGMVPVAAEIDGVAFSTSLFPREGTYLLPLKVAVRRRTGVTVGDRVEVAIVIAPARD